MIVLGIDACLGCCSVALVSDEGILAECSEEMVRGHVERLAPMVAEVLVEAGVEPTVIDRIGVTCGPGSFTGARLGVSFARGLTLSSGAVTYGISTLEALASSAVPGRTLVALDGRRGDLFVQVFENGAPVTSPEVIAVEDLDNHAIRHDVSITLGPNPLPPIDATTVAHLVMASDARDGLARPLYLRAPDAEAAARPVLR